MKLRRLQLTDFRGAPGTLDRGFNDNNYFVYAENGRGKSTIADALELVWSVSAESAILSESSPRFEFKGITDGDTARRMP